MQHVKAACSKNKHVQENSFHVLLQTLNCQFSYLHFLLLFISLFLYSFLYLSCSPADGWSQTVKLFSVKYSSTVWKRAWEADFVSSSPGNAEKVSSCLSKHYALIPPRNAAKNKWLWTVNGWHVKTYSLLKCQLLTDPEQYCHLCSYVILVCFFSVHF